MFVSLVIPALVLGVVTALTRPRDRGGPGDRAAGLVYLLALACGGIAAAASFPVLHPASPLAAPGGVALVAPLLAVPALCWWWRGRAVPLAAEFAVAAIGTALVAGTSFPWSNRGTAGWLTLGGLVLAAPTLVVAIRAVRLRHLGTGLLWGALVATAAPIMVALTNVGNAQTLAQLVLPLAASAVVGLFVGPGIFALYGVSAPLAVLLVTLTGNAVIRYVPGSDAADAAVWILRSAGLGLLAAPIAFALLRRIGPRVGLAVGWIAAILILAGSAGAAQWAYGADLEAENTDDSEAADFYQNL